MSWNPIYGLLLLGIIAATYLSAVMIEDIQMKETIINRSIMAASVGICLITLGVFKYSDFFLQNLHRILGLFHIQLTIPKFSLLLPVGISFYTEEKEPYDILFFGSSRFWMPFSRWNFGKVLAEYKALFDMTER